MFTMNSVDEEFVNRPGGRDAGRGIWMLLVAAIAVIAGFIGWAAIYEIEEVTRATGRVVPSSQVQSVQTAEGGIVSVIAVAEGDVVEAGQVMFQIDDTSVQSSLGELEQRFQALTAERARLEAEAVKAKALSFPEGVPLNASVVAAETAIFASRKAQLELELNVLRNVLSQREAELAELIATRERLEAVAQPLRREVEISEGLFRDGAFSEIEILRLRGDLARVEGDLTVSRASEGRILAGIEEIRTQMEAARASYSLTAQERMADVIGDLAIVEESLRAARARVSRTALRAPVRGTINRVHVTNVGGVVQPGMALAEIVPLDDTLLIEAEVRPRDVAFVRVDAAASVKITAYDYLRYGDLPARVERIGADALQTTDGEPYFQVMLRTDTNTLSGEDGTLSISPGMIASIDIQSGRKTVLEYLVQPVVRAQHEALRER
ncbi:HlyD family type I secretion periplasmic adaptor subunit [Ovoidimarina sediminis]|uniref:HlyD family type I secretion periplasmic adaptor subunit n=1 Tax=Ovoidimarina sediminis TaxID=3079856 RepID=UPI00290E72C1|nr:HlyD family type I secretion periplasmic adaptor subunit [Rhodophyticola sp. MJ-SS7]MDU8946658.1 HlyD family type I secretion periplasmic adaptor subunit [Rhodophyticola sp. MJ-SS7]